MAVRYEVRAFYDAKRHGLAFQTWNIGETSRDMEISAAQSRDDLAVIEWRSPGSPWLSPAMRPSGIPKG